MSLGLTVRQLMVSLSHGPRLPLESWIHWIYLDSHLQMAVQGRPVQGRPDLVQSRQADLGSVAFGVPPHGVTQCNVYPLHHLVMPLYASLYPGFQLFPPQANTTRMIYVMLA